MCRMNMKQEYSKVDILIIVGSVLTMCAYYFLGIFNIGMYVLQTHDDALTFLGYTFVYAMIYLMYIVILYKTMDLATTQIGNRRKEIRLTTELGVEHPRYKLLKHCQIIAPGAIMLLSNLVVLTILLNHLTNLTSNFVLLLDIQMRVLPFIYSLFIVLEEFTGIRLKLEQDIEGY